ncbi:zinc finger domain-containing protein [Actinoplanes siamensis]|uniref:zinc finger domain-containing protein n=1 Tax=Actinoplanes siamensis TaxID=1223317 RepID=UPI004039A9BF
MPARLLPVHLPDAPARFPRVVFGHAREATDERPTERVERHPCPRCQAQPGSPCRSRSGVVATSYHTGRFTKVGRLSKSLRVLTPVDRGPGQPWRPGTPPPAPRRRTSGSGTPDAAL